MIIRPAHISDAPSVQALSVASIVDRASTAPGLVEYPAHSVLDYQTFIHQNPYFRIAESSGTIRGFIAAYSSTFIRTHGVHDAFISTFADPEYLYADQLVVTPSFRKHGVGESLLRTLVDLASDGGFPAIWTVVARAPLHNVPSQSLVEKVGFEEKSEYTHFDGLTFGVYRKQL